MSEQFIQTWRQILIGDKKSWVLFKHGTCVILMQPDGDIREQAVGVMREWGPVHAGSPAGDFSTIIGLFGRSKRDRDAAELEVIHVHDGRNAA